MTLDFAQPRSNPSGSRVDRRRARTRTALLAAAETLLGERPSAAINVDEIAELADVAKGTLYNHFADKDALIREVEAAARDALEAAISESNQGVDDAAVRVVHALAAALRFAGTMPRQARTLLRMSPDFGDPQALVNIGVKADVRVGLDTGRFRLPSEEAGIVLIKSVIQGGMSRMIRYGSDEAADRLALELGTVLLAGLGLPAGLADGVLAQALAPTEQTGTSPSAAGGPDRGDS